MRLSITYFFYKNTVEHEPHVKKENTFSSAIEKAGHVTTDYFALVEEDLKQNLNYELIERALVDADIIHCGSLFGSNELLTELQITSLSWFFLNTPSEYTAVSWKASPQMLIIKREAWLALKGFNLEYTDDYIRVMDFAYRALRSGGRVYYNPEVLKSYLPKKHLPNVGLRDVFLFTYLNIHKKAATTILFYKLMHSVHWKKVRDAYTMALTVEKNSDNFIQNNPCWKIIQDQKRKEVREYSAIIPTLNRYDYLPEAINSLLRQDFPPSEIIVYDQTDKEVRDLELSSKFDQSIVKFMYSDEKGQSSARNNALKNTSYEWCMLFDDDSVALPGMMSEHKRLLEYSEYLISTGASLSPGQQFSDLPYAINFYHLADVLDTGNLFIHKDIFRNVGYLDLAFNKGPGVDNDFGTQLFKKGYKVVFNPKAVRLHYKASTGGLRTFGVWWRFKTSLLGPYPPPSQTYTIQKHYDKRYWKYLYVRYFIKAGHKNKKSQLILLWLLSPVKLFRSLRVANELKNKFATRENTSGN